MIEPDEVKRISKVTLDNKEMTLFEAKGLFLKKRIKQILQVKVQIKNSVYLLIGFDKRKVI